MSLLALPLLGVATPAAGQDWRGAQPDEIKKVAAALDPLLVELGYAELLRQGCKVDLAVNTGTAIWVVVARSERSSDACRLFAVGLTSGAIQSLSVPELQALLAHDLGHLYLRHLDKEPTRRDIRLPRGWRMGIKTFRLELTAEEEGAADDFAVRVLRRVQRDDGERACRSLGDVLERADNGSDEWSNWRTRHGSLEGRIEVAQRKCRDLP